LLIAAVAWGLENQRSKLGLLRHGDWLGILFMAMGLGSLIVFLEEGNRNDWLNSGFIATMGGLAVISLIAWVSIELTRGNPFVNLRLLGRRNFGIGSLVGMAFGAGMYGATYLLPMYLAQIQGYNAQQIGETIMWSGLPQVLMMPLAVLLLKRIDSRIVLTLGLILFSGSSFMNSTLSNLSAYDQLRCTQVVRALGMPLVIVPITTLATGLIEPQQAGSASALFNMFRNLGGSIGIALLATQLDVREKLHSLRLGEALNVFSPSTSDRLSLLTRQFAIRGTEVVTATQQAAGVLARTLRRESFVMAYADCFFLLGAALLSSVALVWFCQPAKSRDFAAH
jgi:DHA2 family multidrug resistance protein